MMRQVWYEMVVLLYD